MSKCKITFQGGGHGFVSKLVTAITKALMQEDGPCQSVTRRVSVDSGVSIECAPFPGDKLSFTPDEFRESLRPEEMANGSSCWSIQTIARYVLTDSLCKSAHKAMKERAASMVEHFDSIGKTYHAKLADLVSVGVITGGTVTAVARAVLSEIDATCEAGEVTMQGYSIEPLPAQVGHLHSAEAIALAGLVCQRFYEQPSSRAYKLASKIIEEATGVTRG